MAFSTCCTTVIKFLAAHIHEFRKRQLAFIIIFVNNYSHRFFRCLTADEKNFVKHCFMLGNYIEMMRREMNHINKILDNFPFKRIG